MSAEIARMIEARRRLWMVGSVTLATLAAACSGSEGDGLPSPDEVVQPANEEIPMEPYPDTLPEPYIIREDEGFTPEEAEARAEIPYIVQPGDSLALIAERFGVETAELQRINGIVDPSVLRAGDELRVPVREGTEAERIAATLDADGEAEEAGPPPGEEYVVQSGDTLSDIGVRFGVSYLDLQSYNRLTEFEASNLQVGDVIIIPPEEEEAEEEERTEPPG